MNWIKAIERLPELPNPLPPNTDNERGVVFANRAHSCTFFWFPSYGTPANELLESYINQSDEWSLEQFEWLDESHLEAKNNQTK